MNPTANYWGFFLYTIFLFFIFSYCIRHNLSPFLEKETKKKKKSSTHPSCICLSLRRLFWCLVILFFIFYYYLYNLVRTSLIFFTQWGKKGRWCWFFLFLLWHIILVQEKLENTHLKWQLEKQVNLSLVMVHLSWSYFFYFISFITKI